MSARQFSREKLPPRLVHLAACVNWWLAPRGRRSRRRLQAMRDRYRGQRCFILGNGPSISRMDLSLLADEITFTLNRGYLLFDLMGGPSTFHVAVNALVVEQWADELAALPNTKFLPWSRRHWLKSAPDVIYLAGPIRDRTPRFSVDLTRDLWPGATVTYAALQIAYYLGFTQVVLIGVDHRFQTQGPPNQTVLSQGEDPNHFDPRYFGPGARWQLPDLETSELAYMLARYYFTRAGREVLDATLDGALQVFPKVNYESLFQG